MGAVRRADELLINLRSFLNFRRGRAEVVHPRKDVYGLLVQRLRLLPFDRVEQGTLPGYPVLERGLNLLVTESLDRFRPGVCLVVDALVSFVAALALHGE